MIQENKHVAEQPQQLNLRPAVEDISAAHAAYQTRVSFRSEDSEWDAFLAATPSGHYAQTSLWARVKSVLGWRAARIVVTQGERMVGGVQLLLRSIPFMGAIGYVPKGPVVGSDDPTLAKLLIEKVREFTGANRVQYLRIEPPCNSESLVQDLLGCGFRPSSAEATPSATLLIDLTQQIDDILAQMKARTRANIRHGLRNAAIRFREGTEIDLPVVQRLLLATSERQKFPPYPEEYIFQFWRMFRLAGYIRLFLVEHGNEAVSAMLAVTYKDTMLRKIVAWSGFHGNQKPNELLDWGAIRWAKSHGYRYYDFEDIDGRAARDVLPGRPAPPNAARNVSSYKLAFGGKVTLFPQSLDYIYNPALRWASSGVLRMIRGRPWVESAVRGIGSGWSLIRKLRTVVATDWSVSPADFPRP